MFKRNVNDIYASILILYIIFKLSIIKIHLLDVYLLLLILTDSFLDDTYLTTEGIGVTFNSLELIESISLFNSSKFI